jgi:methyl-accepting chemotaxis protein
MPRLEENSLRISKEIKNMIEQIAEKSKNFSTHLRTSKMRVELILPTIDIGMKASING